MILLQHILTPKMNGIKFHLKITFFKKNMNYNLEKFKLSKKELSCVTGGVRCYVYDRDYNQSFIYDMDGAPADRCAETLANELGPGFNVACH